LFCFVIKSEGWGFEQRESAHVAVDGGEVVRAVSLLILPGAKGGKRSINHCHSVNRSIDR